MSTKKIEKNPQPTNHQQIPPKKYGVVAYVISRILNGFSCTFITAAIVITLVFYGTTLMDFRVSKTGTDKFPFEVLTPDFFLNKSYFVDKSIKTTIDSGLKSSQEIVNIAKQKDQSKDLFRRIEELNRQRFILISGEPGTGKTFTTKTILGGLSSNYRIINIVPSSLQSKYIGESAKILAGIFKYIAANQNTKEDLQFVVFFDECDTLLETSKERMGREPLINQFLLIAGGDDKIKRLPFVCIFTTNTNVHQMMERGHRRFTHVTPALMTRESLKEVFKNYSEDKVELKEITDLDDFCAVFENQVLQFPLDFLKKVCGLGDVQNEFSRVLVGEKESKERIFLQAFKDLKERALTFEKTFSIMNLSVKELEKREEITRESIKKRTFWMERHKQELQSVCVDFRRVKRLAGDRADNEILKLRTILEELIEKFRETAAKLKATEIGRKKK